MLSQVHTPMMACVDEDDDYDEDDCPSNYNIVFCFGIVLDIFVNMFDLKYLFSSSFR